MNNRLRCISASDVSLIKLLLGCKLAELCYNKEHNIPVDEELFNQISRLYKLFSSFVD